MTINDDRKDLEWQLRLAEAVQSARQPCAEQWPTERQDQFMTQLQAYIDDLRSQLSSLS